MPFLPPKNSVTALKATSQFNSFAVNTTLLNELSNATLRSSSLPTSTLVLLLLIMQADVPSVL